ncbi:conserved hypothetical protein [Ricinus communis]|uniref:Retrotransposon gag domain-containing protein n=2 Tax=Ricinus communis TaxID=3988 RepID=B9T5E2_RICCO|nr:conserved hypothetical protein [Ricinus communis]
MSGCWSGLTYERDTNGDAIDYDQTPFKSFCAMLQSYYLDPFLLLVLLLALILWRQHQILKKLDNLKNHSREYTLVESSPRTDGGAVSRTISDHIQRLEATLREIAERISGFQTDYAKEISKVKLEFPRFIRIQEPAEWLHRIAQYFEYASIVEDQKVPLASFYLEEEANQWLQWLQRSYKQDEEEITWEIFKKELVSRFGPSEDSGEALSRVKQTGSLRDYIKEFERLSTRVENCPTKDLIQKFIGGLQEETAEYVRMYNPKTLHEMVQIARYAEVKLSRERHSSISG